MPEKTLPRKPGGVGEPAASETAVAGEATPKKHYEIDIYRAWCKKCGLCAAFCPRECLALDEEGAPRITHPERCTGCGWCELHCPDFAISVRECLKETAKEEAE